ncbi:MAG: ABC transporter ATP-binding protein [Anaerolineae bacterium]|nr:ABC transporter ATP-binding protein [Anaerolineae bacterium]
MNISLRQYWDLLARHIQPQKLHYFVLTVFLLSSIGLQIFNPQIMRQFIDAAQTGAETRLLLQSAITFIALAIVQQLVTIGASYFGENVAWTATNALRAELARHCLYLDMSYHNNTSPGKLIERIDGDVMELSNFFSQLVIRVVGNLLLLVGVIGALTTEDWRLGAVFTVYAVLALFALNKVRGLAIPHQKAFRESTSELFGYLEERLAGTEDIRSSGAVDFVVRGLYKLAYTNLIHWKKAWRMFLVVRLVGGMLMMLANAIALVSSYALIKADLVTIGTAFLIIYYVNLLGRPIRELTQQAENIQNIGAATERLAELRAIECKIVDGPGAPIPAGPLALHFDEVAFSYTEDEPVLKDISFHLTPGKVLGLLGRTGSGKTTLARLVFRLYDPVTGVLRLNDVDIRTTQLRALRQRVAMVTQDVQLFQATVRENLTFFDKSIPDTQIQDVIEQLELADWYNSLPEGLDTKLETGGRGLSAGEAQLLAFTRVFLRDPGLVILDEASSRLDPATEQLIERAVDKLLQNRTAIIIAHRLGTVQRADEIMILQDGAIIEHGGRERLAADPKSKFYNLLQTGLEEVLA